MAPSNDSKTGSSEGKGKRSASRSGKPADLAGIKPVKVVRKPSTATTEIEALIAAEKRDRCDLNAHGSLPETSAGFLKRTLAEMDPLHTALEQAGFLRESAVERLVRTGGIEPDSSAIRAAILGTDRSQGGLAAEGVLQDTFAARAAREAVEGRQQFMDSLMGRGGLDKNLSALREAEAIINGQFVWGSAATAGQAALEALKDTYAVLGIGTDRDHLLGLVTGVGSVARIAAGLADPASDMKMRTSAMLLDAERQMSSTSGASFDFALRAGHADLFPTMRVARNSEIEAVIAAARVDPLKPHPDWAAEARATFEAMTTPWVRADLPDASIEAMSRLASLDRLVGFAAPGGADVVAALRARLGDYREGDVPAPEELDDPIARTGYQLERGFDPLLTVLPTAVLTAMFAPFHDSDQSVAVDPDHIDDAVRMMLKRLEQALRRFIVEKLCELHGDDWFDRLSSDIRRAWSGKRQGDIDAGRVPEPLINYADIDHYRKIIERPDHWEALFEPVFRDMAAIHETLRRIAVIRNPNAHFRAVSVEDLIILRAEGAHLARWLGIRLGS